MLSLIKLLSAAMCLVACGWSYLAVRLVHGWLTLDSGWEALGLALGISLWTQVLLVFAFAVGIPLLLAVGFRMTADIDEIKSGQRS